MTRKRPRRKIIIIAVIGVLGFLTWTYLSHWPDGGLEPVTVEEGWVSHEKTLSAVFANVETVLTAPTEGNVIPVEEGQRFRKGDAVARVIPTGLNYGRSAGEVAVNTPHSGIFYSTLDGLEQLITPENMMNLGLDGLMSQMRNIQEAASADKGKAVSRYSPIGKVVDNLSPSWMFVFLEETDAMEDGSTSKYIINDGEYLGTVMKLSDKPKGAVICLNQYVNGSSANRRQNVVWKYKQSSKGMLVPLNSLYCHGEEKGVYVVEKGIVTFKGVRVLDANDSVACVEGLLEGAEIIPSP